MPTGSASAPDLQQSPAQVTHGGQVLSEITPPPQPKHALTWPQSMELITRVLCYFRLLRHEMAVPKGVANTQGEVTRTVIPAHDGNVARPSPPGRLFFLFECEPWGNSASLSSCCPGRGRGLSSTREDFYCLPQLGTHEALAFHDIRKLPTRGSLLCSQPPNGGRY